MILRTTRLSFVDVFETHLRKPAFGLRRSQMLSGDHTDGEILVPIPNTIVKPVWSMIVP